MASINDKFIKTSVVGATKLSSPLGQSASTLAVESTAGWHSDTAIVAVIDRVNAQGEPTPEKMEIVIGTLAGSGLENMRRGIGGTQQAHSTGAVVELSIASSEQWNRLIDAMINMAGQDGKLKEAAFDKLNPSIPGEAIKDGSIEPAKIKSGSIPFVETSPTKQTVPVGLGYSVTLTKFGKLVFVSSTGIANITSVGARSETIPAGWRPAQTTALIGVAINNTNFAGGFSLIFNANGSIQWHGARGHNEYHISAVYFLP